MSSFPEALENPVAVIDTRSLEARENSIVVIVDLGTTEEPVLVGLVVDGEGTMHGEPIDCNEITTVHKRENTHSLLLYALKSQISNRTGIYYWDKKRTISTLGRSGVQFPRESHGLPNGLIKSISDQKSNVKRKIASILDTQQFKRWFGKSKVVHADGTPMIVYHGTDAVFSVFDPTKSRSNMDIQGSFFSP